MAAYAKWRMKSLGILRIDVKIVRIRLMINTNIFF